MYVLVYVCVCVCVGREELNGRASLAIPSQAALAFQQGAIVVSSPLSPESLPRVSPRIPPYCRLNTDLIVRE